MAEQSRTERDRVRRRRGSAAARRQVERSADRPGISPPADGAPAAAGRLAADRPPGEPGPGGPEAGRPGQESDAERRRRRAVFLRELAEARELRARVQPRRTKERRMREALRMRTFRI